jgi:hypothetical protein
MPKAGNVLNQPVKSLQIRVTSFFFFSDNTKLFRTVLNIHECVLVVSCSELYLHLKGDYHRLHITDYCIAIVKVTMHFKTSTCLFVDDLFGKACTPFN